MLAMVLLPLLYVGLCIVLAFITFAYTAAVFGAGVSIPHNIYVLAIIASPIFAGVVGLFFMVKPLLGFTFRRQKDFFVDLKRQEHPELFQLIDEICERVGSPKPVRVRMDNRVNASAGFHLGPIGFLTNRLVLTIGTPLVKKLTVAELGGVLAHEFGHFTQAGAMRLSYIIRSVDGWFVRVVFDRDRFDEMLDTMKEQRHIVVLIMGWIANGFVWVARKSLWLLMMAGHAICSYLMRQMEYDADYYERQIVGTEQFKQTFLKMNLLMAGEQIAINHLQALWARQQLVDNLPLLICQQAEKLPEAVVQQFCQSLESENDPAPWHSNHPSNYQRISLAVRNPTAGILHSDTPAHLLLKNIDPIARELSVLEYRENYKLPIQADTLLSTEKYLGMDAERAVKIEQMKTYFGGLLSDRHLAFPEAIGHYAELSTVELVSKISEYRDWLEQSHSSFATQSEAQEAMRTKRAKAYAARCKKELDIAFEPKDFDLADNSDTTITQTIEKFSGEISQIETALAPSTSAINIRFSLACELIARPEAAVPPEQLSRANDLKKFLTDVHPIFEELNKLRLKLFLAGVYLESASQTQNTQLLDQLYKKVYDAFPPALEQISKLAAKIPYPVKEGPTFIHLYAYLSRGNTRLNIVQEFLYLRSIHEKIFDLYTTVMLELLDTIVPCEKSLSGMIDQPLEDVSR